MADLDKQHALNTNLKGVICGVIFLALVVFGVLGGMMLAANEISKESHVSQNGQMTDRAGNAVQAAELLSFAGLYDLPKLDVKTLVNTKKVVCSLDNGEDMAFIITGATKVSSLPSLPLLLFLLLSLI